MLSNSSSDRARVNSDYFSLFQDFLQNYVDDYREKKYMKRIKEMLFHEKKSIPIDYEDIARYSDELLLALDRDPQIALEALSEAIKSIVEGIDEKYAMKIRKFYGRLTSWVRPTPIREMRSDLLNKLVMLEGIVVKSIQPKGKLVKATYVHTLPDGVQHEFTWPPDDRELEEMERPTYCPKCAAELLEEEGEFLRRGSFRLILDKSIFIDWQLLAIQERPEDTPPGQPPRSIYVVLSEDIVDTVRPGDRVTSIGIVKLTRGNRKMSLLHDLYIEANNIIPAQRHLEEVMISPEDEAKIVELSRDPMVRRKIVASIAPAIHGYWDLKEAIAILLFGGVPKHLADGTRIRGEVHILLIGDPGTAKSQLLQYASRIAPRGLYTTGKGSSAAGLTAAVVRDRQTGEFSLEAGAMVLADGGIVAIDEIDKMREEDRVAIHEAMEQGSVTISKAGIHARLSARASVLAAANPKRGRYIDNLGISENINLPITILSRFDLIFIIKDIAEIDKDRQVVRHILDVHSTEEARAEIPPDLLRKYIAYARKYVRPRIMDEAKKIIENYYIELRKRSAADPNVPLAITTRQLEALIRLSEAHARMALKNEVSAEDSLEAIRLMNTVLEKVGLDVETGMVDIDIIMSGRAKSFRDKEILILEQIREHSKRGECTKYSELEKIAESLDVDHTALEKIIHDLKKSGDIYEPKTGCYMAVEE
ncbi:MAG: minichromosome maintenance protein MCM [Sulfolobales archaeon]|nr:minichromosome maintenance protein MCM [Sulfolobales archaeon]MDW8083258.1 minichromosome maintenance protein MCM [Sulfolobales archaeon]